MTDKPIIIIGSGLAGYTLAREFRKLNKERKLMIVTTDDGHFYSKPNLSNAFTHKKTAETMISTRVEKMREDLNAEILTNSKVERLDTAKKCVVINQTEYAFCDLVLAVGAMPRRLSAEIDPKGVAVSVNSRTDFEPYEKKVETAKHITIIGSGLIGCEFANDLASHGKKVTVIGPSELPLQPLVPVHSARNVQKSLAQIGIEWQLGSPLTKLEQTQSGIQVKLANNKTLTTDLVVSAIGIVPNLVLAKSAKLTVNNGIVVDEYLQTNVEHIYAMGDCAEFDGQVQPFVMPIMQQARVLAKTLHGERTKLHYPLMPVVIKTSACQTVVLPPPRGTKGDWKIEPVDSGTQELFTDSKGKLRGFALTGAATHRRAQLVKLCETDAGA